MATLRVKILGVKIRNIAGMTIRNFVFHELSLNGLFFVGRVKKMSDAAKAKESRLMAIETNCKEVHFPCINMIEICRQACGADSAKPS